MIRPRRTTGYVIAGGLLLSVSVLAGCLGNAPLANTEMAGALSVLEVSADEDRIVLQLSVTNEGPEAAIVKALALSSESVAEISLEGGNRSFRYAQPIGTRGGYPWSSKDALPPCDKTVHVGVGETEHLLLNLTNETVRWDIDEGVEYDASVKYRSFCREATWRDSLVATTKFVAKSTAHG